MFDKNNIVPCVDWFRGVVPVSDVRKFVNDLSLIDKRLSLDSFVSDGRSLLNFANRYCHLEVPSLTFAFNRDDSCNDLYTASLTHNNAGILISLSGDAIRYLGADSLRKVLYYLHKQGTKCTRLDFALDFFDKDNDIVPLMQKGLSNFICPKDGELTVSGYIKHCSSNWQCFINAYPSGEVSYNYTLGNHGSDHGMFRLYDKKYEIMFGRNRERSDSLLEGRDYWYRAEIELHNGYTWWADDAFHNLCENDFNLYAAIGHAFDNWFSFKICKYASHNKYIDYDLWSSFVSELVSIIHFVQLVHQKFVSKDKEYAWKQIEHYSTFLSVLLRVGSTDSEKFANILYNALRRVNSESKFKIRYGSILSDIEFEEELLDKLFAS